MSTKPGRLFFDIIWGVHMVHFSVIVPNLHSPIVNRTIESLRNQDYQNPFEIIVVGQDRYGLVHEDEHVRMVVTPKPVGPAIARNLGVSAARGEIIAFIDADCLAAPDWLSRLDRLYQDPEVMVVGGGVSFLKDNFWSFCDNLATFYEYSDSASPGARLQLPSLNFSARRFCFDTVGLFDERYPFPAGEDAEFTTRLRMHGFTLFFDPSIKVLHLPPRTGPLSVFRHAYNFGRYSIKIHPQYRKFLHSPFVFNHWLFLLFSSPFLAAGVLLRISRNPIALSNIFALPVIFLIKLVWCFGAASTLRSGKMF